MKPPSKARETAETEWQDDDRTEMPGSDEANPMEAVIGYKLRRAQVCTFKDFQRRFRELGIRPAEFAALKILHERPGLRHAEVARLMGVKGTNFVPLMDSLERQGLAMRRPSKVDRRSHALYLTEDGMRIFRRAIKVNERHEAGLVRRLGGENERRILMELLDRLIDE